MNIDTQEANEVSNKQIDKKSNQTISDFISLTDNLKDAFSNRKKLIIIFFSVLFGVCAVIVVFASIYDYPISAGLNNPNEWFSWFMQDYGEWPMAYLVNVGFFVVLFVWLIRTRKKGNYLFLLFLIPLAGAGIFGWFFTAGVLIDTWWIVLIINVVGIGGMTAGCFFIPKKILVKILYFMMLAFIISNLAYFLMLFTKWLWGRVRFRDIGGILDPDLGFTHWFIINGPNGNEAFFSGHVLSALSLTFAFLAPPIFKIKNKAILFFIYFIPTCFAASMMYSRIVTGAHYLSDVTFSVIIFALFNIFILRFGIFNIFKTRKKTAITSFN